MLELPEELASLILDVAGEWLRHAELETGERVRVRWMDDGTVELENEETGHAARFRLTVTAEPVKEEPSVMHKLAQDSDPEPSVWGHVVTGDLALGGDGNWYEVSGAYSGLGVNKGATVVTLKIGSDLKTYNMDPAGSVQVKRGPEGQAMAALRAAGMDPEVLR